MTASNYINSEDLVELINRQTSFPSRFILAISGPPGSGKSTISSLIANSLGECAKIVPMDGFHLENQRLKDLNLLHRKGSPETFDAYGFLELIRNIRKKESLTFPIFNRDADETIKDAETLCPKHKIIIIEGNYLLLNKHPWSDLREYFDLSIYLEVSDIELEKRLTDRWIEHGLDPISASARAINNDMANVSYVKKHSIHPDFKIRES